MASKPSTIEKVWVTEAGFKAVVILTRGKFRCGYVGVESTHPLFEIHYDTNTNYLIEVSEDEPVGDRGILSTICGAERMQSPAMVFDVHGSLTFSNKWSAGEGEAGNLNSLDDGLWYFGFDCAHSGDGELPDLDVNGDIIHTQWMNTDPVRSLEYVVQHCESLAKQIKDKTLPLKAITFEA